jgi:cytochrome P450
MGCPHLEPLLSLDPEAVARPQTCLRPLREESPVVWDDTLGCFVVTSYDDVLEVLRNAGVFSSRMPTGPVVTNQTMAMLQEILIEDEGIRTLLAEGIPVGLTQVLLNADPPAHDRQRGLVNRAFTPRRVKAMEDDIRRVADRLIDRFAGRGSCEFISEFAVGLPLTVIAGALGVPDGDLPTFKRWSDDFVVAIGNHLLSKERLAAMLRSQVEFAAYFRQKIEERRADPRDDLISDVVTAQVEGAEPLTELEMLGMFSQFLVAGNETTTKLLGSTMLLLLNDPEMHARVRADRAQIPELVEEALRLEAPVQGLFRVADRETTLGGVRIPPGSSLWLHYASANRDDAQFADADLIVLNRENARAHLSFGQGVHYCLGAALSRAEARIGFEAVFDRLEDIALAPGARLEYEASYVLHGLKELPLTFRSAGA